MVVGGTSRPRTVGVAAGPLGRGELGEAPHERRIAGPYLLVAHIPCGWDGERVGVSPLWAKDLGEHLAYIDRLVLAVPVRGREFEDDEVGVPMSGLSEVVALPDATTALGGVLKLPRAAAALWRAVGRCRIVHVGPVGWPVPYGWVAAAIAVVRRRFLVVLVESAPWRPPAGSVRSLKQRAQTWVYERMARWCLARADVGFVTQAGYAQDLAPRRTKPIHVLNASWIDRANILSDAEALAAWEAKLGRGGPLRVVYAGRLDVTKGVRLLLEAMMMLGEKAGVGLDIYGEGALQGECEEAARKCGGSVRVRGLLPYGEPFFAALREADLIVVPSLSDEQPRVVFDAYSQAVPVLASDTAGLRDCVTDGIEGELVPMGDAAALAEAIQKLARCRSRLRELGLGGLRRARTLTHREMHRKRCGMILDAMEADGEGVAAGVGAS